MAAQSRLSKNCVEALLEFGDSTAQFNENIHLCVTHGDKVACENIESWGKRHDQQVRDRVWKYCFKW